MIDHETTTSTRSSAKRWGSAAALLAAGLAGGIVIAGTVSANAATGSPSPSASSTSGTAPSTPSGQAGQAGPSGGQAQKPAETALTGDTAAKVTAAALAKYPGATVDRVETDSEGVYEAHITTTDGKHVIVAVDKSFTVTGTQEMQGRGGKGGPGNGETPLTGTTADKVKAAALAKYPGATVDRVETDSEGVYEAHITTTDGKHVIVAVGKDFTVTGTQEMPAGGPRGGHGPNGQQGQPGGQSGTQADPAPSQSSTA
jgi:uncharacterized membrane protein YkoI